MNSLYIQIDKETNMKMRKKCLEENLSLKDFVTQAIKLRVKVDSKHTTEVKVGLEK